MLLFVLFEDHSPVERETTNDNHVNLSPWKIVVFYIIFSNTNRYRFIHSSGGDLRDKNITNQTDHKHGKMNQETKRDEQKIHKYLIIFISYSLY